MHVRRQSGTLPSTHSGRMKGQEGIRPCECVAASCRAASQEVVDRSRSMSWRWPPMQHPGSDVGEPSVLTTTGPSPLLFEPREPPARRPAHPLAAGPRADNGCAPSSDGSNRMRTSAAAFRGSIRLNRRTRNVPPGLRKLLKSANTAGDGVV